MALTHKTRRRLALLVLVVGLPLYILACLIIVAQFERPPIWLEFIVYVVLGILWALPFKFIFKGVGRGEAGD